MKRTRASKGLRAFLRIMFGDARRLAIFLPALCIAMSLNISAALSATQCKISKTPDGYVALGAGPSQKFKIIVRMRFGDEVEIQNTKRDPWFEVRRWRGPIPYYKTSRYPISRGWTHKRFLVDCDI